ncbi:Nucleotide-diphospho-sugar transferases [Lasallia pustulata]|uniref:Nucleotide-diphospho-sugar transferases n=1 Tax=Lasallia pustulata TaxID=136370 RepID=A0A1W5D6C8_9LECA|nr:Nucleotide-diphospho-sugar transferases [Lasallia pustulata]
MYYTKPMNFIRRRCYSAQRLKQSVTSAILIIAVYGIYIYSAPVHHITIFAPKPSPGCKTLPVPPPISDAAAASKLWERLAELFDAHKPPQDFARPDNPLGIPPPSDWETTKNWLSITPEEMEAARATQAAFVQDIPAYPEHLYNGRGLVMVIGGVYSEYGTTSLGMLRHVGSTLPVEAWMKDSSEETVGLCENLAREGIACRLLSDYVDVSGFTEGFQFKIASIFLSSFREVLFLDADNIPVRDPEVIFDSREYQEAGAILWPDFWKSTESPMTGYITGASDEVAQAPSDMKTVEAGQMLWDKKRHWKTLCLSAYYNFHGPKYYYTLITQGGVGWGDKDTFPTALRALKAPWYLVPHPVSTMVENRPAGVAVGIAMVQYDPTIPEETAPRQTPRPLFLHCNTVKWGIRHFMCATCAEDPAEQARRNDSTHPGATFQGRYEDSSEGIYKMLRYGKRLLRLPAVEAWDPDRDQKVGFEEWDVDPERDMWMVMERIACAGVWRDEVACQRTREHLEGTFGVVQGTLWEGGRWDGCVEG